MPHLERTIDFTKFTLGLAAAGFAYIAEAAVKRHDWYIKGTALAALLCFAIAVIFGALVLGRAAKVESLQKETLLQRMGQLHSASLTIGLILAGAVVFLRIIWQGE